jgi:hypothetical protein
MTAGGIEDGTHPEHAPGTAAPHPEEMRATLDVSIGKSVSINATARATPAGLVAAAILISAILIPVVLLSRSSVRRIAA